jgi:hypothetical protein
VLGYAWLLPLPAAASGDVAWNVACPISHFGADDPIVKPNLPGASHMHAFYGNTSTNASSSETTLLANSSTCLRGFSDTDHSGYWIPALYRQTSAGSLQQISGSGKDLSITVYYRGGGAQTVTPFPQGLKMIAGDATATSPQPTNIVHWSCKIDGTATKEQASAAIPSCQSGQSLHSTITFPSCWNGKNLDSADHKSHMAYPAKNVCPADHPVRTPQVVFQVNYKNINGASGQYELSSGGQYSMHGDFFAAWDAKTQSALVNSCLNAHKSCVGIQKSQVNLASATPGAGGAVLGAQATASPTSTLPQTGPASMLGGLVGVSAIGYLVYRLRLDRRSLRAAFLNRRL